MAEFTHHLLWSLLGEDGPPSEVGAVVIEGEQGLNGLTLLRMRIVTETRAIPTLVLLPPITAPRGGVVIYCHAHGHRHDIGKSEIISGRPALLEPPLGCALAMAGHVVVCPDMPGFGDRVSDETESAMAKALHWQGRTLFGQMLRDLCLVHETLPLLPMAQDRPCGVVGFSMGAFLSFWLAALRPDIVACAHMCGFASLSGLIAAGGHDLHAPYLMVPGLLRSGDLQDVAGMIKPRPQLVAAGLQDPLTPASALAPSIDHLARVYGPGGDLTVLTEKESGHRETPQMRAAVIAFFDRTLGRADPVSSGFPHRL